MPSTWMPFRSPRKHDDGVPSLLVKYHFGPSNYQVWLTDLTYLWTESLDRRQIVRKALNGDTSIDPSEDSAQLRLFLQSIADALRQRPGTSVTLDQSNDIQKLTLTTLTPLPHPLRPLEWSLILMLAPQPEFASEFLSPLLSKQLTAKTEKISLLQQLKEKDYVISKLIEKLQGDGVDLGKVFPGAMSSKSAAGHTALGILAKSIKGLREFDQDRWEAELAKENGTYGGISSLLSEIFDDDEQAAGEGLRIADSGEWWKRIGRKVFGREDAMSTSVKTDARQENVGDDEFQTQLTPTKSSDQTSKGEGLIMDTELKLPGNLGRTDSDENDSTTDESNDDLQPSRSKPVPSGENEALATNTNNCMQSEPMDLDDNDLTASSLKIDENPAKAHPVLKSKQKLGKIGGKGKDSPLEAPVMPTLKPKLGKIGGKGKLSDIGLASAHNGSNASKNQEDAASPKQKATDSIATPKSERRGRTAEQPPEPSPPRETSQERADRKRAQLKRELENKSHAAVKKKRRF